DRQRRFAPKTSLYTAVCRAEGGDVACEMVTPDVEGSKQMRGVSTDLEALLTRVAEGATRACGADDAAVWFAEENALQLVAHFGPVEVARTRIPLDPSQGFGRAVLERPSLKMPDVEAGTAEACWLPATQDNSRAR